MRRWRTLLSTVALGVLLSGGGRALSVRVTDPELRGLLAYGVSQGRVLTLWQVARASGAVRVFIRDGNAWRSELGVMQGGRVVLSGNRVLTKVLAARGFTVQVRTIPPRAKKPAPKPKKP